MCGFFFSVAAAVVIAILSKYFFVWAALPICKYFPQSANKLFAHTHYSSGFMFSKVEFARVRAYKNECHKY